MLLNFKSETLQKILSYLSNAILILCNARKENCEKESTFGYKTTIFNTKLHLSNYHTLMLHIYQYKDKFNIHRHQ